ncbi:hypothetical protein F2P81_021046 [Scophthalmus maximus]|uniref:Uncharacterized protein n=1 Tax=Scophthalmus maximus TaxID=52904 RepID=A0A6A4S197_SCOMX|nr:hypothetical protein F2P81_021046 [Scophthalmus maximus]
MYGAVTVRLSFSCRCKSVRKTLRSSRAFGTEKNRTCIAFWSITLTVDGETLTRSKFSERTDDDILMFTLHRNYVSISVIINV